jgi:hypothetical protein
MLRDVLTGPFAAGPVSSRRKHPALMAADESIGGAMKALGVVGAFACALALTTTAARAEPITIGIHSASAGVNADASSFTAGPGSIDLGTITMGAGSFIFIGLDGLARNADYSMDIQLGSSGVNPWTELTAEVLDPLGDPVHHPDPPYPGYVPAGFATSSASDGLSFAQSHGLERSATWAGGGSATVFADEDTDQRDLLRFVGFTGTTAHLTFGLRDYFGGRGFLLRLSVNGTPDGPGGQTPEPASMLLLGTGLTGLFGFRRRRLA